jgi:addiction module HigA family antidote
LVKANARPEWRPTHPGALLREEVLPALRYSVTRAAKGLGVSRQTLHAIVAEKASVTPEMALRLGRFCGNGPGLWLRMQQEHDLHAAEEALADVLACVEQADARHG